MPAGAYLVALAIRKSVPLTEAAAPTRMYFTAFDQVISTPWLVLALTGIFVILSQLKINITNAYAGLIAWSNFFSRLTHSYPGRVAWLVFNVAIALILMELGTAFVMVPVIAYRTRGIYYIMPLAPNTHNIALVVDDSPEAQEFVSAALEDIGMTVPTAHDGSAAIELVKPVQPDKIMMDAMMPGMDGFEACQTLKSARHATDEPIIVMTGLNDRDSIVRGQNSGGVDHITKPVGLEEMTAPTTYWQKN